MDEGYPSFLPPQLQLAPYNQPQTVSTATLLEATNPDKELYDLYLSLQGLELNDDGVVIKKMEPFTNKQIEPLCNARGAEAITRIAKSAISQNSIMSNYEEDQISKLILYIAQNLIHNLIFKKQEWGIKSNHEASDIVTIVTKKAYDSLNRAKENGERRLLRGTQQEQIITTNAQAQKGKNFMQQLFGGK